MRIEAMRMRAVMNNSLLWKFGCIIVFDCMCKVSDNFPKIVYLNWTKSAINDETLKKVKGNFENDFTPKYM